MCLTGIICCTFVITLTMTIMQLQLRPIGNSQGVILPRPLLQQVGISHDIEVEVTDGAIILRPAKSHPRTGWDQAFAKAIKTGHLPDDDLFEGASNAFDQSDWQW